MIEVEIKKPLYGNYVYIRDVFLKAAIRRGEKVKVTVPAGSAVIDPKEWIKNGKRMEKVFKNPKEPMILFGGNVPVPAERGEIKSETNNQTKLF